MEEPIKGRKMSTEKSRKTFLIKQNNPEYSVQLTGIWYIHRCRYFASSSTQGSTNTEDEHVAQRCREEEY